MVFGLLVLMIGLRHEVGGDWIPYMELVESAGIQGLVETVTQGDPAYNLLNWVAAQLGLGVYLVNSVCAVMFTWGLLSFCRSQPRSWLALVVAVPYLITVVAMGYSRQGVAIGLIMLGLVALAKRDGIRYFFCVGSAALFHQSAIILIPMVVLASSRNWLYSLLWAILSAVLFVIWVLQAAVDRLINNYLLFEYDSTGAAIRVAMNAVPAVIFLMLRKRFHLSTEHRRFWTLMAYVALVFVFLLYVSPSSTAVDRIALYWIPLQLFVLSRIPDAVGQPGAQNAVWVIAVVAYSALVYFVWLYFAAFSYLWLPYQFYPWVWMWK